MDNGRSVSGIAAAVGMLILIFDSRAALASAGEGVILCIKTVIPSIFPFLFLSHYVTAGFQGGQPSLLSLPGRFFRLPKGSEMLLIPAFLGGYPVGAQRIGKAFRQGQIKKSDAEKMLPYCSNVGPAFLFGMAGSVFDDPWAVWALWATQILSAMVLSSLFPCSGNFQIEPEDTKHNPMMSSVQTMGAICGWVVCFRVVIGFLERWILWRMPHFWQVAVMGILELSNGCLMLTGVKNIAHRFVLAAFLMAFGGICVLMQTVSVTKGLSIRKYLLGKWIQAALAGILAICFLQGWGIGALIGCFLTVLIPGKIRKNSRNTAAVGV